MYLTYTGLAIGLAIIDRFMLERRKVHIVDVEKCEDDARHIRFAMRFQTKHKLRGSRVSYTLRDKKDPTTVINGKERPLDFSHTGENNEFLLFNKKLLTEPGRWVLDVKITSDGSRINPLYKIFPIETTFTKEFEIE
ncbi:LYDB [Photobacterium aphoticum]|uniref:LYDB n=1 Tax=Photobacterium aphoticum TaxID=754436 RepID=A0A090R1I2_9GAMM|nr:LYDB [Photobacterium aphoticum]